MSEEIIMFGAPEAALYRTDIKGWVSRTGIFYGENGERTARYDGCTHRPCERCQQPTKKSYTKCHKCRDISAAERFEVMPEAEWDGKSMVYSDILEKYYSEPEDALDDLPDGGSLSELRLIICEPNYARKIDEDYFCDEMTEDGDLPDEVVSAMIAFNTAIDGITLSWSPGKCRLKLQEQPQ